MDIDPINAVLQAEHPGTFTVQSYDARGRQLLVAFTWNGGSHEDDAYVVSFAEAILFHLPSVLYAPVLFRVAVEEERVALIPPTSYDADEVSGTRGACTVLLLENANKVPYGYYVAAENVLGRWMPKAECPHAW